MSTTFKLEDLVKPLSRAEVQAAIYEALAILKVNTTSWKPGAVVRTTIVGASIVLAGLSSLQADIARSGFLEYARGRWLTLVARYVYGVEREVASFATGEATLTNTGGGVYELEPGDLVLLNPTTKKEYRNTTSFTLLSLQTITIAIQAIEAGAASSSPATGITDFTTQLLGVASTNAAALVGFDEELDPPLRTRCRERLGALSPLGPWDAYASAARNARRPDGTPLGITRVRNRKDGYGNVWTYLATGSGGVPGTVGDLDTDLGIADEAVQRYAAPLPVTAWTVSATPKLIAVTYELWMYNTSGLTQAQVEVLVETRLRDLMAGQPIGGNIVGVTAGKMYASALRATIVNALPEIFESVVTAPAGDTSLLVSEVPTLGAVTCLGVHQVPPPEGFSGVAA